jgi:hypothetical protein
MEVKQMESTGLSASDVALMNRDSGWEGSSFMWIFALLILAGGGSWFGNGYQPQYATQDFVQNGFNFNDLQSQNRDIMQRVDQAKYDNINVAKDIQAQLASQLAEIKSGEAEILGKQSECCCNTLRAIDGVNYNMALNTAAVNQNVNDKFQKVMDAMAQNKIESLQQQLNALQLKDAMNGVVRYPNQFAYNAGSNPFCGCGGCGC